MSFASTIIPFVGAIDSFCGAEDSFDRTISLIGGAIIPFA